MESRPFSELIAKLFLWPAYSKWLISREGRQIAQQLEQYDLIPHSVVTERMYQTRALLTIEHDDISAYMPYKDIPFLTSLSVMPYQENAHGILVEITFEYVFMTDFKHIRVGCHGKYTPMQAAFLNSHVGGDPICGGGLKHKWIPRQQEKKQLRILNEKLDNAIIEPLSCFVIDSQKGVMGTIMIDHHGIHPQDTAFLHVFLGDAKAIKSYEQENNVQFKAITLHIQATTPDVH